jgi:hypothetical protein
LTIFTLLYPLHSPFKYFDIFKIYLLPGTVLGILHVLGGSGLFISCQMEAQATLERRKMVGAQHFRDEMESEVTS